MIESLARGMVTQQGNQWDDFFAEDITNHLFETVLNEGGLDLVALNIQRGRDHGITG